MNWPEMGSHLPTVCTGNPEKSVESDGAGCKARPKASGVRVSQTPALHMASILVHPLHPLQKTRNEGESLCRCELLYGRELLWGAFSQTS